MSSSYESFPLLEEQGRNRYTAPIELLERLRALFSAVPVRYLCYIHLVLCWILIFFALSLVISHRISPHTLTSAWILGYAVQCLLYGIHEVMDFLQPCVPHITRTATNIVHFANTTLTFVLAIVGSCWVIPRESYSESYSPELYGFSVFFLVFDFILMAVFLLTPGIIAIARYFWLFGTSPETGQDMSSNEVSESLTRFTFRAVRRSEIRDEIDKLGGVRIASTSTDSPTEPSLLQEDAECCICKSIYKDGEKLTKLPCQHNFHTICINHWLHRRTNCPLCRLQVDTSNLEIV